MSNDTTNVQQGIVSKGVGDDTYVLSGSLIRDNANITISDTQGSNRLLLVDGLEIVSSRASANTLELTLINGAVVTVLGAEALAYHVGGNPLTGIDGVQYNYRSFGAEALGLVIPDSGVTAGGHVVVGSSRGASQADEVSVLQQASGHSHTVSGLGTLATAGDAPALVSGRSWYTETVTYSFNQVQPEEYTSDIIPGLDTFSAFPASAEGAVRQVFDNIQTFADIRFQPVEEGGDIRFNTVEQQGNTDAFAFLPGFHPISGDVFLNALYTTLEEYAAGGSPFFSALHEIGHAVGLSHPFEGADALAADQDNTSVSVMSYTVRNVLSLDFIFDGSTLTTIPQLQFFSSEFSLFDVAAIQALYGVNTQHNLGDTVYQASFGETVREVIWDSGGTDLIDASTATGHSTIDLRPFTLSSVDVHDGLMQAAEKIESMAVTHPVVIELVTEKYQLVEAANWLYTGENNLAIAQGVWIENVTTAGGDDVIQDNAVDNIINTGAGNDIIYLGEGGFDTVDAGAGFDTVKMAVESVSVELEQQGDGSYLLAGESFAVSLAGVETLEFSDGSLGLV